MAIKKEEKKENQIRLLTADEIECRIASIKETGCSLLLYKNARVDMRLLDEYFGAMNWKRDHELINGNLFCTISIYDGEKKEWVSKQDVGTESYTEKEKGQASDAFKRAGFNWGIGRELYTAPFIWVTLDKSETFTNKNGSVGTYTRFSVKEIEYNESREITKVVIVDDKGNIRYPSSAKKTSAKKEEPAKTTSATFTGAELKKVLVEMEACKTRAEVTKCWNAHAQMQNNTEFRNLCMSKSKQYPK